MSGTESIFDRIVARAANAPRRILFHGFDEALLRPVIERLSGAGIVVPCDDPEEADGEVRCVEAAGVSPAECIPFHLVELVSPTEAGERVLAFADGGRDPSPERLAAVARATAAQYRLLCEAEPRVALLSFSTHGSARHALVSRVQQALERVREEEPAFTAGGELQGDAALSVSVAAAKAPGDPVAGRANVMVFPDGESGSISTGLVSGLGEARVAGPFLHPEGRPLNRVSHGASADAIVVTAAVTALQAG